MIQNPDKYIERFRAAGADTITFHLETTENAAKTANLIRKTGAKAGITINPNIPVTALAPYLKNVDLVLLMSVFAGFGGQKFIPETYDRIAELLELKRQQNAGFLLEIDGGITLDNAPVLFRAGVDVLVAGNTVFKSKNPIKTIEEMLIY
jgi:ribulose-phosphate 3-epimerase